MKKRKRFEYKLQRRTKEKENYLQYINYEVGLIRLIKMRREVRKTHMTTFFLEYFILNFLFCLRKMESSLEKRKSRKRSICEFVNYSEYVE